MSLRYGILSIFVSFAIFILVFENYETWTLPVEVIPEKGVTKKSGEKIESPSTGAEQKEPADIQSYIFVSEKNIFTPERKEFPIIAPPPAPAQVKPPIVRPQIILYGVTLAGDYQAASIVNPGRPRAKGEREVMSVKVGDQIGEFKVAEILPDRIMIETAGDSFEVLLYDPRTPKQRTYAKTEARPASVTTTLPTPAALPTAVPTPAPVSIPGVPTGVIPGVTTGVAPGVPTGVTPGVTTGVAPAPSTPTMTSRQPAAPTSIPDSSRRFTRERTAPGAVLGAGEGN